MRLIDADVLLEQLGKIPLVWEYGQAVQDIYEMVNEQPTINHLWIPVSERLPEKDEEYLVTVESGGEPYTAIRPYANRLSDVDEFEFENREYGGWYNYDSEFGYYEVNNIIAWMPLSEPYKENNHETN